MPEISRKRLEDLLRSFSDPADGWQGDIGLALRELLERRKGEYICPGCHLRQKSPQPAGEF